MSLSVDRSIKNMRALFSKTLFSNFSKLLKQEVEQIERSISPTGPLEVSWRDVMV
jgi:hypothetical protein